MQILIIPALSDNYIYLLSDGLDAVVVDPGESAPVVAQLQARGWRLQAVWLTHRHNDHTAGAAELRRVTGCAVIGPAECAGCRLDRTVAEGETVLCGAERVHVLDVPGHTLGHVAFVAEREQGVWTGDTLFVGGCGRLLEGTARQMWQSLNRFRDLPANTPVYCGHNYTLDNLEFAASILPNDLEISAQIDRTRVLDKEQRPTVPSTIVQEWRTNLFLRAEDPVVRAAVGVRVADPAAVLAELRRRKDAW